MALSLIAGVLAWSGAGVSLTPFQHVGLVPAQPFQLDAALAMSAIGLVAAAGAVRLFARRDLIGH